MFFGTTLLTACALITPADAEEVALSFSPDKMIEVAMFTVTPGQEQALADKYFSKVMPIAQEYGMKPLGTFSVNHVEHGDVVAGQWGFFEWPDLAAKEAFLADRRFKKLKSQRDSRLDELKLLFVQVAEPTTVILREERLYEVFAGWVNAHNGQHLQDYFAVAGPWVGERGAQFHGQFNVIGQSDEHGVSSAPQMFGFMSWPDRSVKEAWFASEAFQQVGWHRAVAVDRLVVLEGTSNLVRTNP